MPKKRYRALVGLAYPTDPRIIKRIQAGEAVPWEERKVKEVEAGEEVGDLPAVVEEEYLRRGVIELLEEVSDDG